MTVGTIIALSSAGLALFSAMILSSMASDAALQGNASKAHSYAKWSAIINGVAFLAIVVAALFLVFKKPLSQKLEGQLSGLQALLKSYNAQNSQ